MTALEELQAALQDARTEAATLRIENTRQTEELAVWRDEDAREAKYEWVSKQARAAEERAAQADVFRQVALAAVAYLAAHAALVRAGVSEERPEAARRLADAWIALTGACAELPAGGPEQGRGAAVSRPADLAGGITAVHDDLPLGHVFRPAPFYPDRCDVQFDEHGRLRTCARPQREHHSVRTSAPDSKE